MTTDTRELLASEVLGEPRLLTEFSIEVDEVESSASLFKGITDEQIDYLVEISKKEPYASVVHGDAEGRFVDHDEAINYFRSRTVYTLEHDGQLAGIIWYGPGEWKNDKPSPSHTFAIRMYPAGNDKRFTDTFLDFTGNDFFKNHQTTGVWLEVNDDNTAALKLYERTGWIEEYRRTQDDPGKPGRIGMRMNLSRGNRARQLVDYGHPNPSQLEK